MRKLMILFMVLFFVASVSAIGITPARTTIDFKPGLQRSVDFEVLNTGDKVMNLVISTQGELAEYISVASSSVRIEASEGSRALSYNINLPETMTPGLHTGDIFVLEIPDSAEVSEAYVRATLAVVTQVYVYVPYPGKYANSKMKIINANAGDDVVFIFPVVSAGEFDLTSVKANVDIYNKLNEKVDSFTTDSISVPSGEKKDIVYKWRADVPLGDYLAKASLIYDEGTLNFEGTFSVGSKELVLERIDVNGFSLGEIVKLEMLIENKWSEKVSDVSINTRVMNDRGDLVSEFESASQDIEPLSKKAFFSFWDTAGVKEGTYETEVAIEYADNEIVESLKFKVEQNDLTIIGLGYVISANKSSGGGGSSGLVIILVIVIVILVLVNLLWFFLLRKRLRK